MIIAGSESFHASYLLASYLLAASLYKIDDIRLGPAVRFPQRSSTTHSAVNSVRSVRVVLAFSIAAAVSGFLRFSWRIGSV